MDSLGYPTDPATELRQTLVALCQLLELRAEPDAPNLALSARIALKIAQLQRKAQRV